MLKRKFVVTLILLMASFSAFACGECEYRDGLTGICLPKGGCIVKTVTQPVKDVVKGADELINTGKTGGVIADTVKTVTQPAKDVVKGANELINTGKTGGVLANTVKQAGNATADLDEWMRTGKCGGDVCVTLAKAIEDTVAESERAAKNLEDAGQAIGHFIEDQAHSVGDTFADAEKRVREGKVIDALWHLGTDPLRHTSDNAAAMAQDSKLIAAAGQIAATAYGGPGGAAAYATWLTYKQTCDQGKCDPELALRTGMITGATSWAMGKAGGLPSETTGEYIKKAVVSGSIGGLAIAASGGDEEAIRKGFMLSAGAVLIRDGYKKVTSHEFDARAPTKDAYCMSTANPDLPCAPKAAYLRDANGNVVFKNGKPMISDIRPLDPERMRTGNWGTEKDTGIKSWNHETGPVMKHVAKVPVIHPMSIFHDQWSFDVNMDGVTNVATIIPAAVITYVGTGAPAYDLIQKTNLSSGGNQSLKQTFSDIQSTEQEEVSYHSKTAAMSTLCIHGEKSRRILLDSPSSEPGYACRVIYQNERGTSVSWYAHNDGEYCKPKAVAFTAKQIALGWSCYVQ